MVKVVNKNVKTVQNNNLLTIKNPEIIFGIVAPIGVNIDYAIDSLVTELKSVNYISNFLKLTDLIQQPPFNVPVDDSSFFSRYTSLIKGANALCNRFNSPDFLAKLAISWVRNERKKITQDLSVPAFGTAYIVRQFKRIQEIELMRKAYGRKFIQVSLYVDPALRKEWLLKRLSENDKHLTSDAEHEKQAIELINRDYMEEDEIHGQEVSEIF